MTLKRFGAGHKGRHQFVALMRLPHAFSDDPTAGSPISHRPVRHSLAGGRVGHATKAKTLRLRTAGLRE